MERKNAWKGYDEAKSAKVDALAGGREKSTK